MSAWCLGILNSHGRFLLSYSAPVLWNLFIIAGLLTFGSTQSLSDLVVIDSLVFSAWQPCSAFGSSTDESCGLTRQLHFSLDTASTHVRSVLINFVPVFFSRGIVQLSAYVDNVLASLLPSGSVALLNCAQTIGLLPISLFGMSISAAELPAMSRAVAGDEKVVRVELAKRLTAAMRRMAFFVIPAAMSFFAFGDTLAGLALPVGAIHARRHPLRLGAPDRFWSRSSRIHVRPSLFVGVLRAPRYAHASAFCHHPGRF